MGVSKGSRVAVISENRYEWVVVHFATLQLGAQFVGLPTNITPAEARQVIKATGTKVLFVESLTSYRAVKEWEGEVGDLKHVVCFEDQQGEGSYAVAIELAASSTIDVPICPDISPDDTAAVMFTAGTTGPPKGVMLSHKCLIANASSISAHLGEAVTHNDMFMSLCSWNVAGALTADLYQVLVKGASVAIPPEIIEGFQDLPEVKPSVVTAVALPFQRAYNNIVDEIMSKGQVMRDVTRVTLGRITESRVMLQKPGKIVSTAANLLLGRFKKQFGSELRVVVVLGHSLTKDQSELLADLDIFAVNTYGCVEAGGIVATDLDVPTRMKVLPGVEVRIVNDKSEVVVPGDLGEVLVESPHAMQGYFDINVDPEESKNALVAYGGRSFVRTGDFGSLVGGWLTVKGHKDILITLSTGKVVDPLEAETNLTKSPFIKQVYVFGENRPYLTALVVPNVKAISQQLKKVERRDGVPIVSDREKADCIRAELRRIALKLPPRQQVRRFAFVEEFTPANGFVTSKWGYARQKIEAHYVHYINALYDETPKFYGFAVDDYDDLF
eukprot:GILI01025648.1.p1 GENE.GILI01025648.1~~GILI01025648.1.p1  ORF type:complete len:589 (-),score=76.83 GILI01025648.1:72-1739(-)